MPKEQVDIFRRLVLSDKKPKVFRLVSRKTNTFIICLKKRLKLLILKLIAEPFSPIQLKSCGFLKQQPLTCLLMRSCFQSEFSSLI